MGAGRKPKPTAMKELEGNPGKRKLNKKEPVPGKGMPDCPKWLLPDAQEEWKRLCEKLICKQIRRALADQGIPFDKKRFSPHITLIRKYSCRGGREIPVSDPPKGSMVATKVSLMRSERGKNGTIYIA